AHIMKNVLIEEFGISEDRIIVEDLARNTFENLLFCKPLIKEERVAIVTSEFHSIRTRLLAHRLHLNCQLIGAKTDSRKRYKWELREQLALVKSLFLDREKR
ncbi:YdcF family protein, partial [Turicibacter sanguinis]|nr:YdcF family protein [Turicibacter sanguinis]